MEDTWNKVNRIMLLSVIEVIGMDSIKTSIDGGMKQKLSWIRKSEHKRTITSETKNG